MSKRPNILLAIADDLAWPHLGAYGCKFVDTPNIDRVAAGGALFSNCYTTAPTCTASRASLLTGRYPWLLEEGCQLHGLLPKKFAVYPDILEQHGYCIGLTNKGWAPGSIEASGRSRNPAGPAFNERRCTPLTAGMSTNDYAANFADFLDRKPSDQPFCFWYGSKEPHRAYVQGSGLQHGKRLEDVVVPGYLPDCETVRSDFLDYALEVERFDRDLGRMLDLLRDRGELQNTLVVVTGDNGFPFPRAKATLYQNGCHVPLAIGWGDHMTPGRRIEDFVSFVDFAPTFLELAGIDPASCGPHGRSFAELILSDRSGLVDPRRDRVLTGRERHGYCRAGNTGYPSRSIVTSDYLYIRNFEPDKLPLDVDASPTRALLESFQEQPDLRPYFDLAFGLRPAEELYCAAEGPDCLVNQAGNPLHAAALERLRKLLAGQLAEQGDPRIAGRGWIFDCYPYFARRARDPGGEPVALGRYQLRHLPADTPPPAVNAVGEYAAWC